MLQAGDKKMPRWDEYKAVAKERGALALELYVVRSTPIGDPAAVAENLPDHLAYQRQLEEAGNLVLAGPVSSEIGPARTRFPAGPISDETGRVMDGSGQIIYRAESMAAARELADSDPMHQAGAREYSLCKWLINEGSLTISVGLSTRNVNLT